MPIVNIAAKTFNVHLPTIMCSEDVYCVRHWVAVHWVATPAQVHNVEVCVY